jgi:hypothetical protein
MQGLCTLRWGLARKDTLFSPGPPWTRNSSSSARFRIEDVGGLYGIRIQRWWLGLRFCREIPLSGKVRTAIPLGYASFYTVYY